MADPNKPDEDILSTFNFDIQDLDLSDESAEMDDDDWTPVDDLDEIDLEERLDEARARAIEAERAGTEPLSLDELDVGAYEIIEVTPVGDTFNFTERMLISCQPGYHKTGRGDFTCILKWPTARVDDGMVDRFCNAVRARISAVRAEMPAAQRHFRVTRVEYRILEDRQHVLLTMARMTEEIYRTFHAERRKAGVTRERINILKNLM